MKASIRSIKRRLNRRPSLVGKRCRTYGPGCFRCENYRFLLERGRFPYTYEEAAEYAAQHDPDDPCVPWSTLL